VKISEGRIHQIIAEEKEKILSERCRVDGVQFALKEIALQSAQLHDSECKLADINENDLKKIKLLAEQLDSIFYRVMTT
jgi:hypothetical protein